MAYYTDLFSPETYEAFSRSAREVSGFRLHQMPIAQRLKVGDKLVCSMTKLSRWIGVLEITESCFVDQTPLFYPTDDPLVVRFRVKPLVWLPKDRAVPIHEPVMWDHLSFTRGMHHRDPGWTGMLRRSLNRLKEEDGRHIEQVLAGQLGGGNDYPVEEAEFRRLVTQRIRRADKTVTVTVPRETVGETEEKLHEPETVRESSRMQALLAEIGERMGFRIWIPKQDRAAVLREWTPNEDSLIDILPLNYDEATLQTIEQIDVIWLKRRAIARAFEVEHTTSVYSGLLRMADLLALQPNMDIKLHIVAPESRREKVFTEIQRPVFSLLERAPLAECCTFLPYDGLKEIAKLSHLEHMSDTVLEEYAESVE